ncbi:hypothetical protein ACRN9L_16220 [Shewanella oncorhynchi]|uniref:hypothetical protein n=1 Tax=Shewanella oncorhynchi TaxID=2726434 RepID=UPI003D791470
MRTLQLLGFILAIAGVILGYITLASIDGQTSEASAGAAGLGMIFMVLPAFGCSALMLVPSSLTLYKSKVRLRTEESPDDLQINHQIRVEAHLVA